LASGFSNLQVLSEEELNAIIIDQDAREARDASYDQVITIHSKTISGRKPISGRLSVRSDSLHRHNLQHIAGFNCKRKRFCISCLSKLDCNQMHVCNIWPLCSSILARLRGSGWTWKRSWIALSKRATASRKLRYSNRTTQPPIIASSSIWVWRFSMFIILEFGLYMAFQGHTHTLPGSWGLWVDVYPYTSPRFQSLEMGFSEIVVIGGYPSPTCIRRV
jgi:hypothetical protein